MKTLVLQGEFQKFENLNQATSKLDADRLPYEVEIRVYVVDTHKVFNKSHSLLTDDEFMDLAEEDGNVMTLPIFQKHYNIGEFDEPHYVIRFITQPLN